VRIQENDKEENKTPKQEKIITFKISQPFEEFKTVPPPI
jgi:hypothetical protein